MNATAQVITIKEDGSIHALRRKPNEGIDLRVLGNLRIKRVTDIAFSMEAQQFYVLFLLGELTGVVLTKEIYEDVVAKDCDTALYNISDGVMYFEEYEDAVKAEILFLEAARMKNLYPALFDI